MLVTGVAKIDVEINPLDALKILEEHLGITKHCENHSDLYVLPPNHENNRSAKRALYEVVDMSWYGISHDEYKFITDDEQKIQCYETLCYIKTLLKENKKLF